MSAQTDLYDGMVADIMTLTNRPDLQGETEIALRTATSTLHGAFNFPRDLATAIVKLPNSSYQVAIDIQVSLPRLRGLSLIRGLDVNHQPLVQPQIDIVEIGDIYNPEYGILKSNIAYMGGTSLNVLTNVPLYGFVIDFYQAPQTRREFYNSWIAQLSPEAIVFLAAALVFQTNGNEEKARSYLAMVENMYKPDLISDYGLSAIR